MSGDETRYDVFISYRWVTPDQEWVRQELFPALQAAGLRPCLDVEDFVPGRDVVLEMARAGRLSRVVLCVITPDYVSENRMVNFEALAARRSDPAGSESKLVPLVLRQAELPDWMRGLVPVDWTDSRNHSREWKKLLQVLGAPTLGAVPPRTPDETISAPSASRSRKPLAPRAEQPVVVRWRPRLIFIKVNPRLLVPYGLYAGALFGASGLPLLNPEIAQRVPFLMSFLASLDPAKDVLYQAMVCSVAGLILFGTVVTGLLNMQIIFSTVKMLFLLALFSFFCALITSLTITSMIPHMLLALVLVVAFTRHFILGQLGYYWKLRSLGDVALESVLMLAFLVLIFGPVRSVIEGRSASLGQQVQPEMPRLPAHLH